MFCQSAEALSQSEEAPVDRFRFTPPTDCRGPGTRSTICDAWPINRRSSGAVSSDSFQALAPRQVHEARCGSPPRFPARVRIEQLVGHVDRQNGM